MRDGTLLTTKELVRYERQINIAGIGKLGQEKLKQGKVVIAGAGGLGGTVALYLAAAGVGTIRMIDYDKVEYSNLNRQVLNWQEDVGRTKVISVTEKLKKLNSELNIEAVEERITEENALRLINGFHLIVDGMDNLPGRYLLNKVALDLKLPLFHGAVHSFQGRATTILPGQTACVRCLYRGDIPQASFPVIGVAAGTIAGIQAAEVIKYIVGIGSLLTNILLTFDGLHMRFKSFTVKRDPGCEHCRHLI